MMLEVRSSLPGDQAPFGTREVNAVVDNFIVGVSEPDSCHELQRLIDVAGEHPDCQNRQRRDARRIRRPNEKVPEVARLSMMLMVKGADDSVEAMEDEPMKQVLDQRPKSNADKKREHRAMLSGAVARWKRQ
jgi:hypothetical protein